MQIVKTDSGYQGTLKIHNGESIRHGQTRMAVISSLLEEVNI